jgi:hypothetical protein
MRALAGIALLLLALAGVASRAAEPARAIPGVSILPGEIASARFAEGVPNLGYDPQWEWQALICSRECALEPVKLTLEPVKVQPYDGEPVDGHVYGIDREVAAHPLVLMRGLPESVRARPDTWLHAGMQRYPRSTTPGTLEIDISLPDGRSARIVPRYAGVIDGTPMFRVYLETATRRQLIGEQAVDAIGGPSSMAHGPHLLRWAGDLDGDGKLDLVMNFSSRYLEETQATLFLSSAATGDEMVGNTASFAYWPVGNPGC